MPIASPQAASFRRDAPLRPSLSRAALHEFYAAAESDAAGTTGAALAFARLAAGDRTVLWVRHDLLDHESGAPYPPGLAEFGIDPARLIFVRARDVQAALQAGLDGARSAAPGAVVVELRGEAKALDLTASRRLALAAQASGTPVLLARSAAQPQPSAAQTRWRVRAAPSRALAANAPGHPAFFLSLLRHRGGQAPDEWHLEWNRDRGCFADANAAPLSRGMVPVSIDRPGGTGEGGMPLRKAG